MARWGKPAVVAPVNFPDSLSDLHCAFDGFLEFASVGIPVGDMMHFLKCLLMIATSCEARMLGEYENEGWWELLGAAHRSKEFQQFLAIGLTRSLVACRAEDISTRTGGSILLQLLYGMNTPGVQVDRVLNGPTNDVWIKPWVEYLERRGVTYLRETEVMRIECSDHRVTGALVFDHNTGVARTVTADYYVAAMPVEAMQTVVDAPLARAEPRLSTLGALKTAWMNGIQLYLARDVPLIPGHSVYLDSPWSITSISQRQFWKDDVAKCFGDGRVHGILSLDLSDWNTPGLLHKKPARDCTSKEIVEEVWYQLKLHLNLTGQPPVLEDSNLLDWNIDRDIRNPGARHGLECTNGEPLLINTKGSWQYRPDAVTNIDNLFLASDYVRTYTQLACMEGANEAARRAVNGILDECGSRAARCTLWPLHEPAIFRPFRDLDRLVYAFQGRHPLDRPLGLLLDDGVGRLAGLAGHATPGMSAFSPLVAALRRASHRLAAARPAPNVSPLEPAPTPFRKVAGGSGTGA
jgi:uncharacterized protein with NAD-binding domain and iron-sulfur cluster